VERRPALGYLFFEGVPMGAIAALAGRELRALADFVLLNVGGVTFAAAARLGIVARASMVLETTLAKPEAHIHRRRGWRGCCLRAHCTNQGGLARE
jgi:hypothetical protein